MTGVAGGNVGPSLFLVRDTTADARYLQASGTSTPIAGISGQGTRYPPYANLNDGYLAILGENLRVYQPPEKEAPLRLGGTVTAGDLLTSDSSGRGITASGTQQVGARAIVSGTIDQIVPVEPIWGPFS